MHTPQSRFHRRLAQALLALGLWSFLALAHAGKPYAYTALGHPSQRSTASPAAAPSLMLMGGGYDVGEAFRWMITRAGITPQTGGHFLVIRASGTDAYNPYIFSDAGTIDPTTPKNYDMVGGKTMGLLSVATLVIPSRAAANDPDVEAYIQNASAIFIAGGDQADYYSDWRGTKVELALRDALSRRIPLGGTSAGAEILSQFAFVALRGGVTSTQALGDPFNKYMSIDPLNTAYASNNSFLNFGPLARTIADVHVNTRDRLGRSIAFMARLGMSCGGPFSDLGNTAIAVDEETALLIAAEAPAWQLAVNPYNKDNFTSGLYHPANSVYFISATTSPAACKSGTPLSYQSAGVKVTRWSAAGSPPVTSLPNSSYTAPQTSLSDAYYGVNKGVITFNNGTAAPY